MGSVVKRGDAGGHWEGCRADAAGVETSVACGAGDDVVSDDGAIEPTESGARGCIRQCAGSVVWWAGGRCGEREASGKSRQTGATAAHVRADGNDGVVFMGESG